MNRLLVVILAAFVAVPVSAATFVVTNVDDSGVGSLRQAVEDANSTASDDTIEFSVTGTIVLTSGELTIDDSAAAGKLTINGPGANLLTISGNSASRVLYIDAGAEVEISRLSVKDGRFIDLEVGVFRPGGGGIYNLGNLTLSQVVVSDNEMASPNFGIGGGIDNRGSLTISGSKIANNIAAGGPTGNMALGGGIFNTGSLWATDSEVSNNEVFGSAAGGIYNSGSVSLTNVALDSNSARACGAIDNADPGTMTLNNSTVSRNFGFFGGSVFCNYGTLTLANSTVSNNRGSLDVGLMLNFGTLTLANSTVAANLASVAAPAVRNISGLIFVANTIIADNGDSPPVPLNIDVSGAFVSLGNNLIGNISGSTGFTATGDQTGTFSQPLDPLLGPLQDNGGPTETHALLAGSPAIDAGSNALIPTGVTTDQRGFLRVANGTVDIGAYEFGAGFIVNIDIKPGSDPNSINLKSKGNIPVAILTTDTFDATQVDWETVSFGPDGAIESHGRSHVDDVDNDGDMDVVLHFKTRETGIACSDTEATLMGETFVGEAITGTDSVNIVKCP